VESHRPVSAARCRRWFRRADARVGLALAAVLVALIPQATEARPAQEGPGQTTQQRRDDVRERQGEVALEVGALEAQHAQLNAALAALDANVATQQAEVQEAQRAAAEAAEDLVEAQAAVAAAEARIDELDEATDEFVVEAYLNPPSDDALDALLADSISDATVEQVLIELHANGAADVFDQLRQAHEDLEYERANREAIAAEAERKHDAAEDELEQLEAARAQQARFVEDAETALDRKLVEAENLAELDAQLSQQIAAEQAALARQLEAARRAAEANGGGGGGATGSVGGPATVTPVPGGLARVNCPGGGAITVAGQLASGLQGLLEAAAADGLVLCGWGYRSSERQVALRRAHCGSSEYAIWSMPSWQCSPPTARPGRSMHEQGLAVDFTCHGSGIGSRSNRCYQWLAGHAGSFGLVNLPSEPWHWSTNGR
jgi:D-alanyl-D-alanine carboxypeptidase